MTLTGPGAARPPVLLHYSEDPAIDQFVPHVPATNPTRRAAVWAIGPEHAPVYWYPRDCPRIAVWAHTTVERERLTELWSTTASRLHFADPADAAWIRSTTIYEYSFDPAPFRPWPEAEGQWIAEVAVRPLAVRPRHDLIDAHASAGVELRFDADLEVRRSEVLASGLGFSIVRWARRSTQSS